MDDMKRAIYLEILSNVRSNGEFPECPPRYICNELVSILENTYEIVSDDSYSLLTEFFPEFINSFDGYRYHPDGHKYKIELSQSWFYSNKHRIHFLNFLLSYK